MSHVSIESLVQTSQIQAFEALSRPELYASLLPPELHMLMVSPQLKMQKGAEYEFQYSRFGIHQLLGLRVSRFEPHSEFELEMTLGIFKSYAHLVRCEEHDPKTTRVSHFVEYELPMGLLGKLYDDIHQRTYLKKVLATVNQRLAPLIAKSTAGV